jgi:hypothetical protein
MTDLLESLTDENLHEYYLVWFNEFLTVESFAEYLGCSVDTAHQIVYYGREAHNRLTKKGDE